MRQILSKFVAAAALFAMATGPGSPAAAEPYVTHWDVYGVTTVTRQQDLPGDDLRYQHLRGRATDAPPAAPGYSVPKRRIYSDVATKYDFNIICHGDGTISGGWYFDQLWGPQGIHGTLFGVNAPGGGVFDVIVDEGYGIYAGVTGTGTITWTGSLCTGLQDSFVGHHSLDLTFPNGPPQPT